MSYCPVLHSSVAVRNLYTSFVTLTSRDQAVVYVRHTTLHCHCIFSLVFCSIIIFVVSYYQYVVNRDFQIPLEARVDMLS